MPIAEAGRQTKVRRNSRRGCGNCKLRKVKCDETRPECSRCTAFGVFCNYDGRHHDLELSAYGAHNFGSLPKPSSRIQVDAGKVKSPLKSQPITSLGSNVLTQMKNEDIELLNRFQDRTVLTLGYTKSRGLFVTELARQALVHPFLMSAILTLTLMHDRSLSGRSIVKASTSESLHWYRTTALFNKKLSGPIQPSERDALWATTVILGTMAFYFLDAETPEEAWPLKPPSSLDLNWIRMSDGKKAIWELTQPTRADSVWRTVAEENSDFFSRPLTTQIVGILPPELLKLCGIHATSTTAENPYLAPAALLAQSMSLEDHYEISMNFITFISGMPPAFQQLLGCKDPGALLVLAYWYVRVCQLKDWWILSRAAMELQAIRIYLHRFHPDEPGVQELLQDPRVRGGDFTHPTAIGTVLNKRTEIQSTCYKKLNRDSTLNNGYIPISLYP